VTDILGFLIIFPFTRNYFLKRFFDKFKKEKDIKKNNFIDGDFEDIEDEDDRKI